MHVVYVSRRGDHLVFRAYAGRREWLVHRDRCELRSLKRGAEGYLGWRDGEIVVLEEPAADPVLPAPHRGTPSSQRALGRRARATRKRPRVKARTGTRVHLFREYVDESGGRWFVSLCGLKTAPVGLELIDAWTPTTCPTCRERE